MLIYASELFPCAEGTFSHKTPDADAQHSKVWYEKLYLHIVVIVFTFAGSQVQKLRNEDISICSGPSWDIGESWIMSGLLEEQILPELYDNMLTIQC